MVGKILLSGLFVGTALGLSSMDDIDGKQNQWQPLKPEIQRVPQQTYSPSIPPRYECNAGPDSGCAPPGYVDPRFTRIEPPQLPDSAIERPQSAWCKARPLIKNCGMMQV